MIKTFGQEATPEKLSKINILNETRNNIHMKAMDERDEKLIEEYWWLVNRGSVAADR